MASKRFFLIAPNREHDSIHHLASTVNEGDLLDIYIGDAYEEEFTGTSEAEVRAEADRRGIHALETI